MVVDDAIKQAHVQFCISNEHTLFISRMMACMQFSRIVCRVLAPGKLLPSPK